PLRRRLPVRDLSMLAPHAGFAVAMSLRQETFQSILRVLYHSGQVPHRLDTPTPTALPVDLRLFIDVPQLVFSSANAGHLEFDLRAWGSMTVRTAATSESRSVLLTLRILVLPRLSVSAGRLTFGLDAANAT